MTNPLTRRRLAAFGAGLAASALGGKSAFAFPLADAAAKLTDIFPVRPPAISFTDAAGRRLTLADYRGSGLVVNLWATWCAPCKAEMPTLAALNRRLRGEGILVLPISIDATGAEAVTPYFAAHRIKGLPVLLDPSGSALAALHGEGVPLTVIIDRRGMMVARSLGGADWNTAAAIAKIREMTGPAGGGTTAT